MSQCLSCVESFLEVLKVQCDDAGCGLVHAWSNPEHVDKLTSFVCTFLDSVALLPAAAIHPVRSSHEEISLMLPVPTEHLYSDLEVIVDLLGSEQTS